MRKPNLLFIFTDEQRPDTLAAYGNQHIQMPHLNRMAEESVVFENCYVTQPVCTASRSSLMTGLYPHTTGCTGNNVPLPAEMPCLPEMVRDDYTTAYFGKWHLGDEIFAQHGFEHWRSIEDFYIDYYSDGRDRTARSDYHQWLIEQGYRPEDGHVFTREETARYPEEASKPAYLANEAIDFIHGHRDEPFILYVNFLEPHMPFFGPRDEQYDPDRVALPENFDHPPTKKQTLKAQLLHAFHRERGHSDLPLKTEADWRRMIANYWGLCSLVDTHVGRILQALDDAQLTDETIIVFTSDHGDMMGSHQLIAKTLMFEEASRVPLMIRLPGGREGGRTITDRFGQIDLVPTLLDLMGQDVPEHLQGRSRRPELLGERDPDMGDVFIQWNSDEGPLQGFNQDNWPPMLAEICSYEAGVASISDPVRTVVTQDGWKFCASPIGEHELYDLNHDPGELSNIFSEERHRPLVRELLGRIRDWQRRTGDTVELPEV